MTLSRRHGHGPPIKSPHQTLLNQQHSSHPTISFQSSYQFPSQHQHTDFSSGQPPDPSTMANSVSGVAVNEECVKVFQELRAERKHRFVVYKMDDDAQQVVVDKVGALDATFDDLAAAMPADDCRYAVYDLDFVSEDSAGDTPRSKIFFIHWSPESADARNKMLYASSTEGLKKELDGVQIDVQATDASELTLNILKDYTT
ncbi:actin-depolymerizing factor 3-like [Triticum urartu]|uniref:ADF-H domain-containing protein n=1 Tax=Triticum urartu TaxID=4572 RepID=A0A8R7QMJ5_TRIUA|nr:actin-depolymerizing factor 3-like [Triticum dicoccoides]XP_048532413.1 actin-depolymerizing factor 3-like [Triticum urartu]